MDWILENIGVITASIIGGVGLFSGLLWIVVRFALKSIVTPENGHMIRGWIVDRIESIPDDLTKAKIAKKVIREAEALADDLRELDVIKK